MKLERFHSYVWIGRKSVNATMLFSNNGLFGWYMTTHWLCIITVAKIWNRKPNSCFLYGSDYQHQNILISIWQKVIFDMFVTFYIDEYSLILWCIGLRKSRSFWISRDLLNFLLEILHSYLKFLLKLSKNLTKH